jgi:hypothetical protein
MPINPRAVAVEGFGFGTKYVAKLGFETTIEVEIRPVATGGGYSTGPIPKPDYEITITIRRKGHTWVRKYLVRRYSYTKIYAKLLQKLIVRVVERIYISAKHKKTINNRIRVSAEVKNDYLKD